MSNVHRILLFMTIIFFAGCATGYQSLGYTGGYSDMQLGENTFKVSFTGNGHTLQRRATDFTLLRSAELTLEHGYRYFIVNSSEAHTRTSFYVNQYGGGSVSKPRVNMIITCFKEKPVESNQMIFNARFLSSSIRKKYGLSGSDQEKPPPNNSVATAQTPESKAHYGKNSEETMQYLLHRSGPKSLREFLMDYRKLLTTSGEDFFTDLLTSPWYDNFKKIHHRNPIIAIIDQGKNQTESNSGDKIYIPLHGGLLVYFIRQPWAEKDYLQETLLKSGKVGVVIYKHRQLSSAERMFQMKHAASRYVKNPGHLEGADAVLVLKKNKSKSQPLAFQPEDIVFPVEIAKVTPVSINIKLIDLATDELLWAHIYPLNVEIDATYCKPPGAGYTGEPSFSNSCFFPN